MSPYKQALRKFQRDYFGMLLATNGGNVTRVAQLAGMDRTYLYRLFLRLGLVTKAKTVQSSGMPISSLSIGTLHSLTRGAE